MRATHHPSDGMEGAAAPTRRTAAPDIRRIAVPAYLVAALLIVFPLADTVIAVLPLEPRSVTWRYGTVGLFSRVLVTPLLGLLVACGVMLLLEHRRTLRAMAVVSGLVAVLLFVVGAFFVLDAVQLRTQVQPAAHAAVEVASVAVLSKLSLTGLAALAFAAVGWRASRLPARARRARGQPVVPPPSRPADRPTTSSAAAPQVG